MQTVMDNETAHAQTDGPEGSSTLPDSVPGRQLEIPDSHEHNVPSTGPQDSFECKPTTEQDVGTDVHSDASRKSGRRSTSYSSSSSRTSLDLDDDDVVVREEDAKVSPEATANVMSSPLAAEVPARHGRGTKRSHDEKTDGGGTITPDDALASRSSSSSSSAEEDTGVGEREPVGFMTEPSASSLLSSPPPPDAAAAASASASSAAPPNSQIPPHDKTLGSGGRYFFWSKMRLSCSLALISVSLSLLWTAVFAGEHQYPEDFSCSLCVDFIQEVIVDREEDPLGFCHRLNVCDYLTLHMGSLQQLTEDLAIRSSTPQELCTERRMCPHASLKEEVLSTSDDADAFWKRSGWSGTVPSATETNLRVTKAMGPVGYNVVRLSIIDHKNVPRPDKFLDFFREGGYAAPFRYRWTDKYLYSKLVSVDPDAGTTLDLWDGAELQIPPLKGRGQPTRGLAVADPCFSSTWVACKWGASYKVLDRLSTALNIASQEPEGFDFWMILGDMFYDRFPGSVDQFFDKLDPRVRVTPFVAVLGNHDIWVRGHPLLKSRADQFGNGFMQYFAMDTVASWNATSVERGSPFDFRVDPDREYTIFHEHHEIAAVQNFVSYFTVGNVGMFSFSGGHTWEETRPYAEDACRYFMRTQPTLVLLLSHWDGNNDGSYADMIGSEMYKHFHSFPGCQLRMPVHYVVGHTHCNQVLDNGVGFMVGGQGMSGCSDFGIPIFETTRDDRFEVLYYPLESEHGSREDVWSCILRHGFGGCKSMATVWYNATLTEQNAQI